MNELYRFELKQEQYEPKAVYYPESDCIEYVREDIRMFYRRIDELLTVALDMRSDRLIGFQIKGIKNFYLREILDGRDYQDDEFVEIVCVLQTILSKIGDKILNQEGARQAYQGAMIIAGEDDVKLPISCLAA